MCDTLSVRHAAGMWFAKNSDRHPAETQVVESHARRAAQSDLATQYLVLPDADAAAFVGSRPSGLRGCEHGVNAHGAAAGNEKIRTIGSPRDLPPALLGMDIVRLVLERTRTADDAVDLCTWLLERYGQGGSGEPHAAEPYFSSFLFADATGGWIVETSNRTWVARPIGDGAALSNRVTLSTDWTRASPDIAPGTNFDDFRLARLPTGVADHRLARTNACVARGAATTAADIAHVLRSHGDRDALPGAVGADWSGFTVCMHRPEMHAQTTASMIVDLRRDDAPQRAWTALGNPCLSVYVPVFPPAVPPQLAAAAQWERFARLRDKVEAQPDEFPAGRAELAAVEADLWAEADVAWQSDDRAGLDGFAAEAYAPVDAALTRLGV
jgi:dipeptidase